MLSEKPFSQACDNNKQPILDVLEQAFKRSTKVLEIGSGTGQHAVHFSAALPHLHWQPSDVEENLTGIDQWIAESPQANLLSPVEIDVTQTVWPAEFDAVYSANTAHIMSWQQVQIMVARIGQLLPSGGVFVLYGPFKYKQQFTSPSNQQFDQWLKSKRSTQGIRDFESMESLANDNGLYLQEDFDMPANNRTLVWVKN